jgi:Fe(3+) dicitrate transport protein
VLGFRLRGQFTGSQYTDVLNTRHITEWFERSASDDHNYYQATASGRIGMMPSYFLMDVSAWYNLASGIGINLQVRNLLDERYIVSRRPQGIRVGLPRMINAGISYNF